MTQEEYATRRSRIYMVVAVGIAAFVGSNTVGYLAPEKGRLAILLTAIFLGCIFIAGRMAFKLKKETAAK
jgi:predicted MFS family arabinose efflux permease